VPDLSGAKLRWLATIAAILSGGLVGWLRIDPSIAPPPSPVLRGAAALLFLFWSIVAAGCWITRHRARRSPQS